MEKVTIFSIFSKIGADRLWKTCAKSGGKKWEKKYLDVLYMVEYTASNTK